MRLARVVGNSDHAEMLGRDVIAVVPIISILKLFANQTTNLSDCRSSSLDAGMRNARVHALHDRPSGGKQE